MDGRKLIDLEVCEFINLLRATTLSTDAVINKLGVSRSKFYKMKKDFHFPKPKKLKGFKVLVYELGDLEKHLADLKDASKPKCDRCR